MSAPDGTGGARIAIVDYGAGNLVSIGQALRRVGAEISIARSGGDLDGVDGLVVPGVGAARPAMDRLRRRGLVGPLRAWVAAGRPFLGICLGLQLLFDGSDEDGARTLGLVAGRTEELRDAPRLPHIGWNQVRLLRPHLLFDGIGEGAEFYFVHSYAGALDPVDGAAALAVTEHGATFVSAIARGALLGVQFHPERSGDDGLRLLANFVVLVRNAATVAQRSGGRSGAADLTGARSGEGLARGAA